MATTGSATLSTKPDPSVPTEVLQKEATPSTVTMIDVSDEAHVAKESPSKSATAGTVTVATSAVPAPATVTPAIAAPAVAATCAPAVAEQVDTTPATATVTVTDVMPPPVNKPQPQSQSQSQRMDATKMDPKTPIVTTMTGIPTALAHLRPSATTKRPVVTNRTPSTAPKVQVPPGSNKKRKLASAVTPSAVRTLPTAMPPLADPHVVTTVHDLMGLLQLYGPLTLAQLDHNLPPPPPRGSGGAVVWTQHTLSDIVELLVATGMVQAVQDSQPLQYCMFSGIPRADVVLPSRIMEELEMTRDQTEKSVQRVAILKQALLDGTPAKEVLKTMLRDYPDIVNDPVYLAALRNAHVDASMIH